MSVETQPQTPPSPGWLPLSHHQSGSQCVTCLIQHSCMYFYHLAASSVRKEGWMCAVGLQNGVTILLHVSKPVGPPQANIKQPEHLFPDTFLVQPPLRWKDQKVFDWGEIAPRSKMWCCLSGETEWFSVDECYEFVILGTCGSPEASGLYFKNIDVL